MMNRATKKTCPECRAADPMFSAKRQCYICEDCGHEWAKEDLPVTPLRIFLSYGHDENEELVRRIKNDLEARGHDVWFDKNEIKFGDEWRREITDGITGSNKVLSFLSKHSTRDPGVCIDEIGIAIGAKGGNIQTILVEGEDDVNPPPSISHLQWLDMHEWKEQQATGQDAWDAWYAKKLKEIVRVVESDESIRFAGEIEDLSAYLKPVKSDAKMSELLKKPFVGREWMRQAVEQWRENRDDDSRLFWIMGAPGVGKSAFVTDLAHFGRDKVIALHFCEWNKQDHKNPRQVVLNIAFQLACRLPDYRKQLLILPEIKELGGKTAAELFSYLLVEPLKYVIDGGRQRYLVIIDALDEANENGKNPLAELLAYHAQQLPEWLGLLITSRPESAVTIPLQGLNPFVLDTHSDANRADLRDYLNQELADKLSDCTDTDHLIQQILAKSDGLFLYAERFCDDVQQNHIFLDRPEQFLQGLGGIYFQWFRRQFPDLEMYRNNISHLFEVMVSAKHPLGVSLICEILGWDEYEIGAALEQIGSLIANGQNNIGIYHKSLIDWLTDKEKAGNGFFVSEQKGHDLIGSFVKKCYRPGCYDKNIILVFLQSLYAHDSDNPLLNSIVINENLLFDFDVRNVVDRVTKSTSGVFKAREILLEKYDAILTVMAEQGLRRGLIETLRDPRGYDYVSSAIRMAYGTFSQVIRGYDSIERLQFKNYYDELGTFYYILRYPKTNMYWDQVDMIIDSTKLDDVFES